MYKLRFTILVLLLSAQNALADDMYREPVKVVLSHLEAKRLGFVVEQRYLYDGNVYLRIASPKILKNGRVYSKISEYGIKLERQYLGANITMIKSGKEIASFSPETQARQNSISITVNPEKVTRVKTFIFYEYYDGLEAPVSLRYEIRSTIRKK